MKRLERQIAIVEEIQVLVDEFEKDSKKSLGISLTEMRKDLQKELLFGFTINSNSCWDTESMRFYGKGRAKIGWENDDKIPNEEYLYALAFPTGAYYFHPDYPTELFKRFFAELCTYNPAFKDSHNSSVYFRPDNAKEIHDAYPSIEVKYRDQVKEELRVMRIAELEAELKKAKKELI